MPRRLDGSDRGVLITQESARRIQRVVQRIEGGDRNTTAPPLPTAFDDGGEPLRVGKVSADWAVGTCATVTLWERTGTDCTPTEIDPPETVDDVFNLSFDVAADSWVVIGQAADGRWYLVEVGKEPDCGSGSGSGSGSDCCRQTIAGEDLTTVSGYDATKTQLLGHENGCLRWIDTSACEEGSGS